MNKQHSPWEHAGDFPAEDTDEETGRDAQSLEHHGEGRYMVSKEKSVQTSLSSGETWGERVCKLKPKGVRERRRDKFSRERVPGVRKKERGKFRKCKLSSNCEGQQEDKGETKCPLKTSTQDPTKAFLSG